MSTYNQLSPQIERNLGNKDDIDFSSVILSSFNAAQRMLAWVHDWSELQVSITGAFSQLIYKYTTATLGFTRFRKIQDLMLLPSGERGRDFTYISPLRWRKEVAPLIPTATSGKPGVYTIWGRTFMIHTTPDIAYPFESWYYQYPSPIVNVGDTIQYEDADDALVNLTTAFAFLSYEEVEMASTWVKRATQWMTSYGVAHTNVAELEASFASPRPSIIQNDYWSDPFAKDMP